VTSVGKGITSLMRFGRSVATETLPGITKKYGLRYAPMSAVHPNIQDIVQHHAAENGLEIAVRAIDPVSAAVSRYTAAAGKSRPKGMYIEGKTLFGLIKERGIRYHTDADIAWVKATRNISVRVYDKANRKYVTRYFLKGQHLTDDAVLAAVVKPLNKRLPTSMRFQHGAHFSSHTAFGGTLDYKEFGLYPGHPGPVSVHRGEGMTMMTARAVEQYAQLGNRLPWHPSWKLEKPVPFNLGLLLQGTAQVGVPTAYFYRRGQMSSGK
jgi:hypothetical protein